MTYDNYPQKGGLVKVKSNSKTATTYLTRYFEEPLMQGKVYASMLVQYQSVESESMGEINWLVQNGWGGVTEKQVSLSFQNKTDSQVFVSRVFKL
mgnify:CR=1 FL=1